MPVGVFCGNVSWQLFLSKCEDVEYLFNCSARCRLSMENFASLGLHSIRLCMIWSSSSNILFSSLRYDSTESFSSVRDSSLWILSSQRHTNFRQSSVSSSCAWTWHYDFAREHQILNTTTNQHKKNWQEENLEEKEVSNKPYHGV